jgi:A/G-specific adenine glycosylase
MASAIAALAHGVPAPAADANVTRVMSRLHAIRGIAGSRAHAAAVRGRMEALFSSGRPADVLAAVMDLGQLVCLPRRPLCGACPLAESCAARRLDAADRFPAKRSRPALRRRHVAAAWTTRRGAAMLVRGTEALLGGLWQFPAAEGRSPGEAAARLSRELEPFGLVLSPGPPIASTRHTMVHRRLDIRIYPAAPASSGSDTRNPRSIRWFTPERLAGAAIPTLTRRIAAAAGFLSRS